MRVAVYTRASTDESHQPYSLEAQTTRLNAYVASQGDWQLVRTFSDRVSGATLERPNLRRALAEAQAGRFDLLLVYRVDRLARSVRGLAQILEELDDAGVAFRSATEPFDTATPAGRMMVQMLGVFAEFERATIIDRVIAGMERKAAKGGWCGGYRPFGYAVDRTTGYLAVKDDEAPLVTLIFDLYARQRLGSQAIANHLNEHGHRTRTGRPWSYSAVLTILRNRVYLGEVFFRDTHHPAPHTPLIDPHLFDTAQRLMTERGEDAAKRAGNSSGYLLTNVLVCAKCGKRFVGTAANGNRYRYRYYTCYSRQRHGTKTCDAERLPADELEEAVLQALLACYEQHDLIGEAIQAASNRAEATRDQRQAELDVVDAETEKTEQAIDRYLLAFETGDLPQAQCGERIRALGAKIAELRDRRTELADALDDRRTQAPTPEMLARVRARVKRVLDAGPNASRKTVIEELVHQIRVAARDDIEPWFRLPSDSPGAEVRMHIGSVGSTGFEPVTSRV